jgi:hypothetical protein
MKNIIIIDTFPSSPIQENILRDCIENIKSIGFDIMLVSHHVISDDIQKNVDIMLYDKDNTFLPSQMTPHWWIDSGSFNITIHNSGHSLPISRNIFNSLSLAKSSNYDFFYFMEFDNLFVNSDILKLIELKNQMENENKKAIFFRPENFRECGSYVYETLIFGGKPKEFLELFTPPNTLEKWIGLNMGYTLELSFYEQMSKYENEFLIIPQHSSEYFNDSKVNVFRYGLFHTELLYNINLPENPVIFIGNYIYEQNTIKHVKMYIDNVLILEDNIHTQEWKLHELSSENKHVLIEVYQNDIFDYKKEYILSEELLESIKLKSRINYH